MKKNKFKKELIGLISYLTNFNEKDIKLLEPINKLRDKTLYENITFEYKNRTYSFSLSDKKVNKKD